MKQIYATAPKGVFFGLLLTIFMIIGVASFFGNHVIVDTTKMVAIIALLTVYFLVRNRMANVFLTIFLFMLIGDAFQVFHLGALSDKLAVTFYLGGYSLLVFVLLGKFKRIKFEGLVSVYLIVVSLINAYLLYVLYDVIKENFSDSVNLVLAISHGIVLIAMTFFAFAVYLSQETTQSIVFLIMVFCFVFSDVLGYICDLYVYYWAFEFISSVLHIASLALFFVYVYNHHKIIKVRSAMERSYQISNAERLAV